MPSLDGSETNDSRGDADELSLSQFAGIPVDTQMIVDAYENNDFWFSSGSSSAELETPRVQQPNLAVRKANEVEDCIYLRSSALSQGIIHESASSNANSSFPQSSTWQLSYSSHETPFNCSGVRDDSTSHVGTQRQQPCAYGNARAKGHGETGTSIQKSGIDSSMNLNLQPRPLPESINRHGDGNQATILMRNQFPAQNTSKERSKFSPISHTGQSHTISNFNSMLPFPSSNQFSVFGNDTVDAATTGEGAQTPQTHHGTSQSDFSSWSSQPINHRNGPSSEERDLSNAKISPRKKSSPKRKGRLRKSAGLQEDSQTPPQPVKPLTAYNFFFRFERRRLLQHIEIGCDNQEGSTPSNISINNVSLSTEHYHWTVENSVAFQDQILQDQWSRDPSVKRKHSRSHGAISFQEMTQRIADGWRKLPKSVQDIFRAIAHQDNQRYVRELALCEPKNP